MFFTVYDYDNGPRDLGGAGMIGRGLYSDVADALRAAVADFADNRADYDGPGCDGWYRVDVWDVGDDYADDEEAFEAWECERLSDEGDVLHLDTETY